MKALKTTSSIQLIVGLGNPGPRYAFTRHNFGFLVIDFLLDRLAIPPDAFKEKNKNQIWESRREAKKNTEPKQIILAKPQTFMNKSGQAILELLRIYKLKPENLLLIYDDKDLIFSQMKLAYDRGDGGHRGLRSVIGLVGRKFYRLRCGIGHAQQPLGHQPSFEPATHALQAADFVLDTFNEAETRNLETLLPSFAKTAEDMLDMSITEAMNALHVHMPKKTS